MPMTDMPPPAMQKRKVSPAMPPPGFDGGDGVVIPPLPDNLYAAQTPTPPPVTTTGGMGGGGAVFPRQDQSTIPGANAGGGPATPSPLPGSGYFEGLYHAGQAAAGMEQGFPFPGDLNETSGPGMMGAGRPQLNLTSGLPMGPPLAPRYLQAQPNPMPGPMPGGQGPGPQAPGRRFPRATSLIPRNAGHMKRNGY
jgi:hypothetical protein